MPGMWWRAFVAEKLSQRAGTTHLGVRLSRFLGMPTEKMYLIGAKGNGMPSTSYPTEKTGKVLSMTVKMSLKKQYMENYVSKNVQE